MTILTIAPNKKPVVQEIDGRLETMQSLVGGMIQAVYPFEEPVAVICNDEGKLLRLPPNRALRHPETKEVYDILCGTVFLCGAPPESESFVSLTADQLERYQKMFSSPELFLKTEYGLMIFRMEE
ncbi:MAG: DUF3846 domain-containing protein [Butyricicoccus pullicaecorum]|nr:DUF3846 domain-containing protein [Butyricicoccus pullicaecorum]